MRLEIRLMNPSGLVSMLNDHARGGKTQADIATSKVFDLEYVAGLSLHGIFTFARVAVKRGQVCTLLWHTVRPNDWGIRLEGCGHVRNHR